MRTKRLAVLAAIAALHVPATGAWAQELPASSDHATARLDAAAEYAMSLPAGRSGFAIVGFCRGGSTSFRYATAQPNLGAAVVFYGSSPASEALTSVQAPVLGLYGGDDARVNATIPAAEEEMARLGKMLRGRDLRGRWPRLPASAIGA